MKRNTKLAIMTVLIAVAVFVWIPKGKKPTAVSANTLNQTMPTIKTVPRKRTEFANWGKDPFAKPQTEEKMVDGDSGLKVSCIMYSDEKPSAFINDSIVFVGDKITDKTVKQIERDRVTLTDGTKDYVLKLQE